MSPRRSILVAIAASGLCVPLARADKLDKESKKFQEDVSPIILPDEEKTFGKLKDKADREEFQKIFWARRDPDLETPQNEFQAEYVKARAEADKRFRIPGRAGFQTDCGRVFILLGEPDDVRRDPTDQPGPRMPETWTYRSRPGRTFVGGEALISFDGECQLPAGARLTDSLRRVAEDKIVHPNLNYRTGKDGRLVKLDDMKPKPTPAQALLKSPRQDFPMTGQAGFLKTQDGGTVLVGLIRGEAKGVTTTEAAGQKKSTLVVCAQAVGEGGKVEAFAEQEVSVPLAADESFVATYRMVLRPGKYTLWGGAVDPKSQKGSLISMPVEVPDLNRDEITFGTLFLIQRMEEGIAEDAAYPFSAFVFGTNRIIPWFGDVVPLDQPLYFFYQFYDAKTDEATGKRNAVATLAVFKGTDKIASAPEDTFEGPVGANLIGPVTLSKYGAGKYKVQLKVKDSVAQKEYLRELAFEAK
jgi:GWxTD domain-containing protein